MIMSLARFTACSIFAMALLLGVQVALFQNSTASAETRTAALPPLPGYLVAAKDPVSGLTFTRITKPGNLGEGVQCDSRYCSHRYSSAQAWNSDQTLLLIANGCHGFCFFDGRTYGPLFHRAQWRDCEWLPQSPEQMVCVGDTDIRLWTPRTDAVELLYTTTRYSDLRLGPGKGNPSRDGGRIAVRAVRSGGGMVAFVYDIHARVKYPDIDLARLSGTNGYCTITPLGEKVVCIQSLSDDTQQTFIFDVNGVLLQSWLQNHRPGHGDMTVGAGGSEYIVGISKSEPDKYEVIARRLDDGLVTNLLPYGEASHVSLRAIDREEWAIVSYEGDPAEIARHPEWAPYGRQIIALALDGSGEVQPIAQTNNIVADYYSETHGSPSPDGSQIIWSSNWGKPGGPVYEFVTQWPWPANLGNLHGVSSSE
jgi:hypothetical protein